jgi:hypothetical protein
MIKRPKNRLVHTLTSLAFRDEGPCRQLGATQVAVLVAAALFKENLDGTIFVTSLPQMAQSFAADPTDLRVTSFVCEAMRGVNLREGARA